MRFTKYVRKNIIAGFLFLLPMLVAMFIFSKMWSVIHRIIQKIAVLTGVDHLLGAALISIINIVVVFVLCFLAGLLLHYAAVGRLHDQVEKNILRAIPGYFFLKNILSEKLGQAKEHATTIVIIKTNDFVSSPGILMDENTDGRCTVFVPASPNANSGIVYVVDKNKLEILPISLGKLYDILQNHGKGLLEIKN